MHVMELAAGLMHSDSCTTIAVKWEPVMRNQSLVNEAERCRQRAKELAGRPEQPFLLRLANAFDELAIKDHPTPLGTAR